MVRSQRHGHLAPFPTMAARRLFLLTLIHQTLADFSSEPRWGQAAAVVDNLLYVSGGKTDQYGSYSYTSAPTSNDLFTLDLSKSFNPSSPPWAYISGSQDSATPQGVELAWHSLAAYNTSQLLMFGGDGGPNSPIVLPSQSNSAQILDISSTPKWASESEGWAGQPPRRIHQTLASNGGKVYLVGGEKDDGSNAGYSDHYVFDPTKPQFTQLPSNNGPPDIYGHCAVILSDGTMLVFGGYSASEAKMISFSTIWTFDTTSPSPSWSTATISGDSLPPTRRDFACSWLEGDKVIIHGGSDVSFSTSYSDGWILDASKSPMGWSSVSALSALGARRDHTAVQVGSQVLFFFGYGTSAGSSTSISIFDTNSNSFTNSFSPQSSPSHTTLPASSGTGGSSPNGGSSNPTGGSNPSGTNRGGPQSTSGGGNNNNDGDSHIAVIAVASVMSVLVVAVIAGVIIVIVIRRRRANDRFHMLHDGDDPGTPDSGTSGGVIANVLVLIPWLRRRAAPARGEKARILDKQEGWTVLGLGRPSGPGRRVDMLANEDSSLYAQGPTRRQGSGSSRSWFSVNSSSTHQRYPSRTSSRPSIGRLFSDPLGSFKHVGAGVKRVISGAASRAHGREGTDISLPFDFDDYEDSEGLLLRDKDNYALDLVANEDQRMSEDLGRLRGGRLGPSESTSYTDPFSDPFSETIFDSAYHDGNPDNNSRTTSRMAVEAASPFSTLSTVSSRAPQPHPLATTASKTSSEDPSSSSLLNVSSAGHSSSSSSHPSGPRSPASSSSRPRTTSIISTVGHQSSPVRRSDSWWARFKRTASIRDSLQDQNKQYPTSIVPLDFRDPNPPPGRLGAIKEGSGGSAGTHESPTNATHGSHDKKGPGNGAAGHLYSTSGHEHSTTSFKTSKTADSAALEKLAGRYDIALREATDSSSDLSPSSLGHGHEREGTWSSIARSLMTPRAPSPALIEEGESNILDPSDSSQIVTSPTETVFIPLSPTSRAKDESERKPVRRTPSSPTKKGAVAARIAEYEKRMSVDLESASPIIRAKSPPTPGKRKSENVNIKYGLVHRPELFIANPDQRSIKSSGS